MKPSHSSGGALVLVEEATQPLAPAHGTIGTGGGGRGGALTRRPRWRLQAQGAVWSGGVVVVDVFAQHAAQVALASDEQPVKGTRGGRASGPHRLDVVY